MADILNTTASNRLGSIDALDEEARKRSEAARAIQFQKGAGQLAASLPKLGGSAVRAAQTLGAVEAQQKGQQNSQITQQTQQNLSALAEQQLQQKQTGTLKKLQDAARAQKLARAQQAAGIQVSETQADITARKQITQADIDQKERLASTGMDYDNRLNMLTLNQREELNTIGNDLKQKLFDEQKAFDIDELGRKFSNERQLADYTVATSKSEIMLNARLQEMEQAARKEQLMFEVSINKLKQAVQQGFLSEQQKLDQASKVRINEIIASAEREKQRRANRAHERARIVKGVVGIVVAVGGTVLSGGSAAAPAIAAGTAIATS